MSESIISARLRRLREEAEKDEPLLSYPRTDNLVVPTGHDVRRPDYRPVEVKERKVMVSEDGTSEVAMFSTPAISNANSGPFENIVTRGWILRKDEAASMRDVRVRTAERLRRTFEGAQVSPLRGQSFEAARRGGEPAPVADGIIDCIHAMKQIREAVRQDVYEPVERVVCLDQWIWQNKSGGAIAKDVDTVLRGLDHVACHFGYLTAEEVSARWTQPTRTTAKPSAPAGA